MRFFSSFPARTVGPLLCNEKRTCLKSQKRQVEKNLVWKMFTINHVEAEALLNESLKFMGTVVPGNSKVHKSFFEQLDIVLSKI